MIKRKANKFYMAVIKDDLGSMIEPTSVLEGKSFKACFEDFDSKIEVQPYKINP